MINKEITIFLANFSDNLHTVNKLIIAAYLQFNEVEVIKNKCILSCIQGNDKKLLEEFIGLVRCKIGKFDLEDVINLFEITIPASDVSVNGAVYTPKYIKKFIVEEAFNNTEADNLSDILVADIASGAGAFLYSVAEIIKAKTNKTYYNIFKENIFGLDISEYTITRAKILLSLLAITNGEDLAEFEFNLFVGNALNFEWKNTCEGFNGFDLIIGNPPYVRAKNLSNESKVLLSNWEVTKSGNPDLYIPFFEIGLRLLKPDGILGFITVNTFKRSVNARSLREFFKSNLYDLKILDFGNAQVFDNKSTYTCIVFIQNRISNNIKYQKITPEDIFLNRITHYSEITYELLDSNKGWILNKPHILSNVKRIENTGSSLGRKFIIKNGIATLSNDIFIFKPIREDEKYFYLKKGETYKIEKGVCRDIIKPNKLKRESEIPQLMEQVIYPYHLDNKDTFKTRNAFDELYFKERFPYAYKYLDENKAQLLNRDKGKPQKYQWFEFGRTQALNDAGKKLLFPYMASQPYFVYTEQDNLLFYAGYAVYSDSERELKVLKCILESDIFWYYITKTSKPYSGNFYALAKNYVKDFGICNLSEFEKDYLLAIESDVERNRFLLDKYELTKEMIEK